MFYFAPVTLQSIPRLPKLKIKITLLNNHSNSLRVNDASSDVIIRDYRKGEEPQINDLLSQSYDDWAGPDYWEWMYADSLHGNNIVVAEKDGLIIGCNHGIYLKAHIGESDYIVHFSNYAAVHPSHRRKGINTRMVHRVFENAESKVNFGYSFSRNPIIINNPVLKIERKFFPRHFTVYTYIIDIDKHLNYFDSKFSFIKKYYHILMQKINIKEILNPDKEITIKKIYKFDHRFNDFHEEIKKRYNFILVKDQTFLNWRYADKRSSGYEIFIAERGDEILGYLVYKINIINDEYPYGMLIDLLTLPDNKVTQYLLIKKAIEELKEKDVNSINFLVNNGNPITEVLKEIGFIDLKRKQFITYITKLNNNDEALLHGSPPEKIHLTYGDIFA